MIEIPIQIRFADADRLGHINNVNLQHYLDLGKSEYFQQIIGQREFSSNENLIVKMTQNTYLAQAYPNERLVVCTRVKKMGDKSITMMQEILNADTNEIKAEGISVMVCFDFEHEESIPIPFHWRNKINRHENFSE